MTTTALRLLAGAFGLLFAVIGLGFLVDPVRAGASLFLVADGIQGMATLRADFPAFFIGAGGCAIYGAWSRRPPPLVFPLILLAIALSGRVVGIAVDGRAPTAFLPMAVEATGIVILALSYRAFAARRG